MILGHLAGGIVSAYYAAQFEPLRGVAFYSLILNGLAASAVS